MLQQLYQHSAALLAPSEGEGFGLPLIEADNSRESGLYEVHQRLARGETAQARVLPRRHGHQLGEPGVGLARLVQLTVGFAFQLHQGTVQPCTAFGAAGTGQARLQGGALRAGAAQATWRKVQARLGSISAGPFWPQWRSRPANRTGW